MRVLIVLLGVLTLNACAPQPDRAELGEFWVGKPIAPFPDSEALFERESTFVYPLDLEINEERIEEDFNGIDPRDAPPPYVFGEEIDVDEEEISIASFNIQNLGWNYKRRNSWEYRLMAEMIRRHDVIVIQEVQNEQGVRLLMEKLIDKKQPWGVLYPVDNGEGKHSESVLFLWKRDRISLVSRGNYLNTNMKRDPYWAAFRVRANDPNAFDFVLMTTHTKPYLAQEINALNLAATQARQALAGSPPPATSGLTDGEPDVILAGDFNAGIQPKGARAQPSDAAFRLAFGDAQNGPPPKPSKVIVATSTMMKSNRANDNMIWWAPTDEDYSGFGGTRTPSNRPKPGLVSDHKLIFGRFYAARDSD